MSTSDRRFDGDGQHRDRPFPTPSLSRYDLVLALIPAAFVLTTLGAGFFDVPFQAGLTAASLVGLVGIADALFLNPPTGGRRHL